MREERKQFAAQHADKVVSEVTVGQILGGLRGVKGLVCDTSLVPPDQGLILRGRPVAELADKSVEEIFFLLLTGELPDDEGLADLREQIEARAHVPRYVWNVLEGLPTVSHPMSMLTTAIMALEHESEFRRRYDEGISKDELWEPMLEDCLSLWAKLHSIAAWVYRLRYDKGPRIRRDDDLMYADNYANMLGLKHADDSFRECMRLYLVLHSDHEGGNVSAFTSNVVGSALSNPYYAVAAGLNGLAGPLHGLANQEVLKWIQGQMGACKCVPTPEMMAKAAQDLIEQGKVVPGYGHAVLRVVDPRFTALRDFGLRHFPDDPVFQTVENTFQAVPEVLKGIPKIKNPYPNVDAISGAIIHHYGLKEFRYYTVLFSVSRAMGIMSNLVLNRGIGAPIVRPKSMTFDDLRKQIEA
jgi:citrate synthase